MNHFQAEFGCQVADMYTQTLGGLKYINRSSNAWAACRILVNTVAVQLGNLTLFGSISVTLNQSSTSALAFLLSQ